MSEATRTRVWEVVLTGGPCRGGTTALTSLQSLLSSAPFRVLTVPELGTLTAQGIDDFLEIAGEDGAGYEAIQEHLLGLQQDVRKSWRRMARRFGGDCIIVYDRGEMDCRAFGGPDRFERLMSRLRLNLWDVGDSYDLAVHMVTAAVGAVEHFNVANNPTRRNDLDHARRIERATAEAWAGEVPRVVVDNSTDLAGKVARVATAVTGVIAAAPRRPPQ
jgi:hypothetical protein